MANTSVVYARINTDIKQGAESVLAELGISPSCAIQMFYRQLMHDRALPFTPHIPVRKPLFLDELTEDELYAEVRKGLDSAARGETYSLEEVDTMLAEEFGI